MLDFIIGGKILICEIRVLILASPTLKLEKEATALTSHREKKVSVTLASGEYSYDGHDGQGQYFRAHSPLKILMNEDRMQGIGGIYIPTDSATQAAVYWQWGTPAIGFLRKVFVAYLPNVPPHTISKVPMPRDESEGFLATLTYGGIAQNQIKFIYREYNDGLARAAFTQEVSLDYKPGQLYAYKDARFTVHHADMVNVEYTISKPL